MKTSNSFKLNTIKEAINDIKEGKMIIVVDDKDRENEGDFIAAAECVTPEMINFMSKYGRGLICAPLTEKRCKELELPLMVKKNTVLHNTQFTVSIDLIGEGCTTGISTFDRAKTIKAITKRGTKPEEFGRPGHIFPLRAKDGGVLRRTGHTEAAIDLARLAGFKPAGILVEILNEDGTMARLPQLIKVAQKHNLKIISIEDLIAYRMKNDSLIDKIEDFNLQTYFGKFRLRAYKQTNNGQIHIALTKGNWNREDEVLVRVNSSLINNDVIHLLTQPTNDSFNKIIKIFESEEAGAIVFINQENQSFNLVNRLSLLKEAQKKTENNKIPKMQLDDKDFGIGAQILHDLDIHKIKLISNNTQLKRIGMVGYDLEITKYVNY